MALASPEQHLPGTQGLLQQLIAEGIEVESHTYDSNLSGSFCLVLRRGQNKARFIWDAVALVLEVQFQHVTKTLAQEHWIHDAFISIEGGGNHILAEIGSEAESLLIHGSAA